MTKEMYAQNTSSKTDNMNSLVVFTEMCIAFMISRVDCKLHIDSL